MVELGKAECNNGRQKWSVTITRGDTDCDNDYNIIIMELMHVPIVTITMEAMQMFASYNMYCMISATWHPHTRFSASL